MSDCVTLRVKRKADVTDGEAQCTARTGSLCSWTVNFSNDSPDPIDKDQTVSDIGKMGNSKSVCWIFCKTIK